MINVQMFVALALLVATAPAVAGSGKDTVAKERQAGTTSYVGNRCAGGSFDKCVQTNIRLGWKPAQANSHCSRTCAK